MDQWRVNERIIRAICEQTCNDPVLREFLIELAYKESEQPFRWQKLYTGLIEKAIKKWEQKGYEDSESRAEELPSV